MSANHAKKSGEEMSKSFGFETVAPEEKTNRVHEVFTSVANRYDVMNDLMSGGIHRLWKAQMVDWLAPRPGIRLLDVAGGTGDISNRVLERVGGDGQATVCDMTEGMLIAGRARGLAGIDWACGNAQALPFPDKSFDAYTIAFGIRNVTHIDMALREARRVLKPGGRFLCLEFSKMVLPGIDRLYEQYSFHVIPRLGQLVANDRDSYQYLVESIRQFPTQENFADMIAEAGLGNVKIRNLSGGIAALHSAWRL